MPHNSHKDQEVEMVPSLVSTLNITAVLADIRYNYIVHICAYYVQYHRTPWWTSH